MDVLNTITVTEPKASLFAAFLGSADACLFYNMAGHSIQADPYTYLHDPANVADYHAINWEVRSTIFKCLEQATSPAEFRYAIGKYMSLAPDGTRVECLNNMLNYMFHQTIDPVLAKEYCAEFNTIRATVDKVQ